MKCAWLHDEHDSSFLDMGMGQRWVDLAVWERMLNSYRELRAIIELGTGRGGFAIYLLLQARRRGMQFWTFDIKRRMEPTSAGGFLNLDKHFHQADIFKEGQPKVAALLHSEATHPLLLFCDNGKKVKEFRMFAPLLSVGDLVAVHDWGIEFRARSMEFMRDRLEPIFFEECAALGSITRFWKVVG